MNPSDSRRIAEARIALDDFELHVQSAGHGPLVVLCHGFPQTSAAWTHQIPALAQAGYRVLAPDMRGYGRSSRPRHVSAYDADQVAGDLLGLLDWAGERQAIFVGHDLGASMIWHLARAHPERVRAVVALSVPLAPRSPIAPVATFRKLLGDEHYLVFFQEPGTPDEALAADVRRTLLTEGEWTREWAAGNTCPERPAWLSAKELEQAVDEFARTGFSGGLAYYRNLDRNWELSARFADQRVRQPTLFITGEHDIVRTFTRPELMGECVPDLRIVTIPNAGHFVQQQTPEEVNRLLVNFADELTA